MPSTHPYSPEHADADGPTQHFSQAWGAGASSSVLAAPLRADLTQVIAARIRLVGPAAGIAAGFPDTASQAGDLLCLGEQRFRIAQRGLGLGLRIGLRIGVRDTYHDFSF